MEQKAINAMPTKKTFRSGCAQAGINPVFDNHFKFNKIKHDFSRRFRQYSGNILMTIFGLSTRYFDIAGIGC